MAAHRDRCDRCSNYDCRWPLTDEELHAARKIVKTLPRRLPNAQWEKLPCHVLFAWIERDDADRVKDDAARLHLKQQQPVPCGPNEDAEACSCPHWWELSEEQKATVSKTARQIPTANQMVAMHCLTLLHAWNKLHPEEEVPEHIIHRIDYFYGDYFDLESGCWRNRNTTRERLAERVRYGV